jgi:hypothetical protein
MEIHLAIVIANMPAFQGLEESHYNDRTSEPSPYV